MVDAREELRKEPTLQAVKLLRRASEREDIDLDAACRANEFVANEDRGPSDHPFDRPCGIGADRVKVPERALSLPGADGTDVHVPIALRVAEKVRVDLVEIDKRDRVGSEKHAPTVLSSRGSKDGERLVKPRRVIEPKIVKKDQTPR